MASASAPEFPASSAALESDGIVVAGSAGLSYSMHQVTRDEGNLVTVRATGTLTEADYDQLVPVWERLIVEEGSMRLLFVMEDFHGWEPGAAWDDFRFGVSHSRQVERVAMVGEKKWQKWLTKIGSVFLHERVRYFDLADLPEAERWVRAQ